MLERRPHLPAPPKPIRSARAEYQEAQKLTPDNEIVYRNLAVIDSLEGKFQDAVDRITKTLRFDPTPRTYITLGDAYYYLHRYPEAAGALKAGLELDTRPDDKGA